MSERAPAAEQPARVRVWDWPTRLFHWLIVLLIPALWWTATSDQIALHVTLGTAMLGLVLFRIFWGLFGSSTARFAHFLKGPRGILSYLNGSAVQALGHNPLGGWSVAAMLLLLAAQVGLGLFASDEDFIASGPLSHLVSIDTSETLTDRHEQLFNILLALIALHVAAILYYAVARRRNLVGPMLTGRTAAVEGAEPMRAASPVRFLLAATLAALLTWWIASGAPLP